MRNILVVFIVLALALEVLVLAAIVETQRKRASGGDVVTLTGEANIGGETFAAGTYVVTNKGLLRMRWHWIRKYAYATVTFPIAIAALGIYLASRVGKTQSIRKGFKLLLSVLILLVVFSCDSKPKPKPQGPFSDKIVQDYVSMASLGEDNSADTYINGKAVLINIGESLSHNYQTAFTKDEYINIESQTVSNLHQKTDVQIRAVNPEQVGTVVLLNWAKEVVKTNIAGIDFCRVFCDVIVVDYAKRSIVGRKQFTGSYPEGTHRWGSSPESEIVAYINSLTRRPANMQQGKNK